MNGLAIDKIKVIGIDPDMRKPGVCGLAADGSIILLESMTIYDLLILAEGCQQADFAIEDVNKVKAIYASNQRANKSVGLSIAQKVGMVKASGTIIIDLMRDFAGATCTLAPVGLGKQIKKDAALFKRITGWQGKTNEDTRDAYAVALWALNSGQTR